MTLNCGVLSDVICDKDPLLAMNVCMANENFSVVILCTSSQCIAVTEIQVKKRTHTFLVTLESVEGSLSQHEEIVENCSIMF